MRSGGKHTAQSQKALSQLQVIRLHKDNDPKRVKAPEIEEMKTSPELNPTEHFKKRVETFSSHLTKQSHGHYWVNGPNIAAHTISSCHIKLNIEPQLQLLSSVKTVAFLKYTFIRSYHPEHLMIFAVTCSSSKRSKRVRPGSLFRLTHVDLHLRILFVDKQAEISVTNKSAAV